MSNQDRLLQLQRVDHRYNVVAQAVGWMIGAGITGRTEPTACNTVDLVGGREPRCELVEYVRCVPASGQQDHRPAGSAPIEYFQPHVFGDRYKLHGMGGWILPRGGLLAVKRLC